MKKVEKRRLIQRILKKDKERKFEKRTPKTEEVLFLTRVVVGKEKIEDLFNDLDERKKEKVLNNIVEYLEDLFIDYWAIVELNISVIPTLSIINECAEVILETNNRKFHENAARILKMIPIRKGAITLFSKLIGIEEYKNPRRILTTGLMGYNEEEIDEKAERYLNGAVVALVEYRDWDNFIRIIKSFKDRHSFSLIYNSLARACFEILRLKNEFLIIEGDMLVDFVIREGEKIGKTREDVLLDIFMQYPLPSDFDLYFLKLVKEYSEMK